jgi:hypothetical protein
MRDIAHLDRLPGKRVDGTSRSDLELVVDHVSQTLVVDTTQIDVGLELFSSETRVHGFVPVKVISSGSQLFTKVVNRGVRIREPRVGFTWLAMLSDIANCHPALTAMALHPVRYRASLPPFRRYSRQTFRWSFARGKREG